MSIIALIGTITPLVLLCSLGICILVFDFKENRIREKVKLLEYMIDHNYETEKVDIDKL